MTRETIWRKQLSSIVNFTNYFYKLANVPATHSEILEQLSKMAWNLKPETLAPIQHLKENYENFMNTGHGYETVNNIIDTMLRDEDFSDEDIDTDDDLNKEELFILAVNKVINDISKEVKRSPKRIKEFDNEQIELKKEFKDIEVDKESDVPSGGTAFDLGELGEKGGSHIDDVKKGAISSVKLKNRIKQDEEIVSLTNDMQEKKFASEIIDIENTLLPLYEDMEKIFEELKENGLPSEKGDTQTVTREYSIDKDFYDIKTAELNKIGDVAAALKQQITNKRTKLTRIMIERRINEIKKELKAIEKSGKNDPENVERLNFELKYIQYMLGKQKNVSELNQLTKKLLRTHYHPDPIRRSKLAPENLQEYMGKMQDLEKNLKPQESNKNTTSTKFPGSAPAAFDAARQAYGDYFAKKLEVDALQQACFNQAKQSELYITLISEYEKFEKEYINLKKQLEITPDDIDLKNKVELANKNATVTRKNKKEFIKKYFQTSVTEQQKTNIIYLIWRTAEEDRPVLTASMNKMLDNKFGELQYANGAKGMADDLSSPPSKEKIKSTITGKSDIIDESIDVADKLSEHAMDLLKQCSINEIGRFIKWMGIAKTRLQYFKSVIGTI